MTEAGRKRRASLHVVEGEQGLSAHDPGGVEVGSTTVTDFAERLTRANHTLKRALTDPHLFSGIGNAYSDEILHRARLSPITLTQKLSAEEIARLRIVVVDVLKEWTQRLRTEAAGKFPTKITAFHPEMAVHGKFGEPCPVTTLIQPSGTNFIVRWLNDSKLQVAPTVTGPWTVLTNSVSPYTFTPTNEMQFFRVVDKWTALVERAKEFGFPGF